MSLIDQFTKAVADGRSSGRLWLYSNYNCNLACTYCLTSSSPKSPVRGLRQEQMVEAVRQAKELGFTSVGITGGEPFLLPWMSDAIAEIASILPLIVLTNGTMLTRPKIREGLLKCLGLPMQLQVSVDDPNPEIHDSNRGQGSFKRAIQGIPWLLERGVSIRISSTRVFNDAKEQELHDAQMRSWMMQLGLEADEHVGRTMVKRGLAKQNSMGVDVGWEQVPADLTLTRMGAFYSPFAPTVSDGTIQIDMLLSRTILPLEVPVRQLMRVLQSVSPEQRAAGDSAGFV